MLFVVFFLMSTAWDQNGLWGFKEWTRKPNLLCFAFLLMKLSNYIMGNKRHLPFPSSTLCVVARSNQYRPHVVSMGYRCDTVVSDEYKNAGKQTILIFWSILDLEGPNLYFWIGHFGTKMKLDLSLCFIYFSSVRSSGVFHVSTLLFKYLPKILQILLENTLLLNKWKWKDTCLWRKWKWLRVRSLLWPRRAADSCRVEALVWLLT